MPNKSSIALLAEINESIDTCLNFAKHVNICMDEEQWDSGEHCGLKICWDSIISNLEQMKQRIEEF